MPPPDELDTIIQDMIAGYPGPEAERPPRNWGRVALLAAIFAGEAAWLAICAKVIWLVWG
jgi:hypothetical protein